MNPVGVVLAGGQSRRFGEDKRFFFISGKPLIQLAVEKLRAITPKIYVVADDKDALLARVKDFGAVIPDDVKVITDIEKFKGPLFGIYSFFKKTTESVAIFVPVDMPYLPLSLLQHMIELYYSEKSHLIFISHDRPFPCVVSKDLLNRISDYIRRKLDLRGFFAQIIESGSFRVITLNQSKLLTFGNPGIYLKNINTKDDLNETGR